MPGLDDMCGGVAGTACCCDFAAALLALGVTNAIALTWPRLEGARARLAGLAGQRCRASLRVAVEPAVVR